MRVRVADLPAWHDLLWQRCPFPPCSTTPSPGASGGDDDAVGLRLAELAANLERELQDVASLEREDLGRGSWVLTPNDQGAVGVAWIDWGDALH